MCVLIYKPKGVDLPDLRIIERAQMYNPHGNGFATLSGNVFKTTDRERFLYVLEAVVNKEDDAMIHLRYATHGSKIKENCHPFEADGFIFAHNGVLPIESKNDMTDSEIYFHRLLPKLKKYGIDSPQVKKDVENIIGGSKFCIFDTQRQQAKLFGHYTEVNGCYFSNLNFV